MKHNGNYDDQTKGSSHDADVSNKESTGAHSGGSERSTKRLHEKKGGTK